MTPRSYNLGKRAQSKEQTRSRILDAVLALHNEKGVVATTMQDIASRADVALHTVYRYFPTINDAVAGCGQLVMQQLAPPGPQIFASVDGLEARVRVLVVELFAMYARGARQIEVMRCQQAEVPALAEAVEGLDRHHKMLVGEALRGFTSRAHDQREVSAMTDFYVWKAFADRDTSRQRTAELITAVVLAHLTNART